MMIKNSIDYINKKSTTVAAIKSQNNYSMADEEELNLVSPAKKQLMFIFALFILPIPGMGVDAYAPSLPIVATYFHATIFLTQLSVPIYTLGYALSLLFSGIIVDMYGTKRSTLVSLIIFSLLAEVIVFAPNMTTVIILRLFQGLSVGFFAVSVRTTIINLYTHDQPLLRSKINLMQIAWSIGPILAPAIGGYLSLNHGWKSSFNLMSLYSLIMAGVVFLFFNDSKKTTVNLTIVKQGYVSILGSYQFILGFIAMGALYSVAITFNTVGSFIIQSFLGLSPIVFGYCSLLLGVAWLIGSLINKLLIHHSIENKSLFSVALMLCILITIIMVTHHHVNLCIIMIPSILLNIFAGLLYSNLYVLTLTRFHHLPSSSAGLMSSGILVTSALGTTILSKVIPHNSLLIFLHANITLNLIGMLLTCIIFYPQIKILKIALTKKFTTIVL